MMEKQVVIRKTQLKDNGDCMDKKPNFIMTTFEDTAKQLLSEGFKLINKSGNQWTFLNDGKMNFSGKERIVETNHLCL